MLLRVLFAAMSVTLLGQAPAGRYDDLKAALGLTDAQLAQLQQPPPMPVARPAPGGNPAPTPMYGPGRGRIILPEHTEAALRVLDDSQRAKLAEIEKVLDRRDEAAFAIDLGLIALQDWHGGGLCVRDGSYRYAHELGLSENQVQEMYAGDQTTRRDRLMAWLNDTQKAELASLPAAVQLAREAFELRLSFARGGDPPLCH